MFFCRLCLTVETSSNPVFAVCTCRQNDSSYIHETCIDLIRLSHPDNRAYFWQCMYCKSPYHFDSNAPRLHGMKWYCMLGWFIVRQILTMLCIALCIEGSILISTCILMYLQQQNQHPQSLWTMNLWCLHHILLLVLVYLYTTLFYTPKADSHRIKRPSRCAFIAYMYRPWLQCVQWCMEWSNLRWMLYLLPHYRVQTHPNHQFAVMPATSSSTNPPPYNESAEYTHSSYLQPPPPPPYNICDASAPPEYNE